MSRDIVYPLTGIIETKRFPKAEDLTLGLVYENGIGDVELVDIDDCYPDTEFDPVNTSYDERHENEIYNSLKHGGIRYEHQPAIAIYDYKLNKWRLITGRTRWGCYKKLGATKYPVRKVKAAEGFTVEQALIAVSNEAVDADSIGDPRRKTPWTSIAISMSDIMKRGNAWYIDQPRTDDGKYDYGFEVWYNYYYSKSHWVRTWGDKLTRANIPLKMWNKINELNHNHGKIRKVTKETIAEEFESFFTNREEKTTYSLVNINDPAANGTYYAKVLMDHYKNSTDPSKEGNSYLVIDQYTTHTKDDKIDKVRRTFIPKIKSTIINYLDIAYSEDEITRIYSKEYIENDLKPTVFNRIWSKLAVYQHNWYDGEVITKVNTAKYAI